MLNANLLRTIRRIEYRTRRLVTSSFTGAYRSRYRGQGMSFVSVRPYVPGDDIRAIDWKITARTSIPHIRQYVAERELSLMILIDGSASLMFGTQERQKREYAAELGAILAYSAIFNNDKAGIMIFTDHLEHYVAPAKGRKHILRLLQDLLTYTPKGTNTDLGAALRTANRVLPQHSIIIMLSDFLVPPENYAKELAIVAQRHDVAAIMLTDPMEEVIPSVGLLHVQDSETGDVHLVDTASKKWQKAFAQQRTTLQAARDDAFKRAGVPTVVLSQDADYIPTLIRFFGQSVGKQS